MELKLKDLTVYERAAIVATRSYQISQGYEPVIPDYGVYDPVLVAMKELESEKLHMVIFRNGVKYILLPST